MLNSFQAALPELVMVFAILSLAQLQQAVYIPLPEMQILQPLSIPLAQAALTLTYHHTMLWRI
jgi:hypothetical protein